MQTNSPQYTSNQTKTASIETTTTTNNPNITSILPSFQSISDETLNAQLAFEHAAALAAADTLDLRIRIADLDYYMAPPGKLDRDWCQFHPPNVSVLKVPVMRIYGSNPAGQKTCVHIHQVYPYFYVPYEGVLEADEVRRYISSLGVSLNHAMAVSLRQPSDLRKNQYVAEIILVKGVPFYGYHLGYKFFLKIYLFNPDLETRMVDLMRSGAVMATVFQPFESHIPHKLQFLMDFNLYGMGWLKLEDVLLRREVPSVKSNDKPDRWTTASVPKSLLWAEDFGPKKMSHCEIELDTTSNYILNKNDAPERDTHKDLGECFQPPPSAPQVPSVAGLWEDDARRRRAKNQPPQQPVPTQEHQSERIEWLNHDRMQQEIAKVVRQMVTGLSQGHESGRVSSQDELRPAFEGFCPEESGFSKSVMTAYEAIDAMCPRNQVDEEDQDILVTGAGSTSQVVNEAMGHEGYLTQQDVDLSIVVDESVIMSQAVNLDQVGVQKQDEQHGDQALDVDDDNGFGLDNAFFDQLEDDDLNWEDDDPIGQQPANSNMDIDHQGAELESLMALERQSSRTIPQYDGAGDLSDDGPPQKSSDNIFTAKNRQARAATRSISSSSSATSNSGVPSNSLIRTTSATLDNTQSSIPTKRVFRTVTDDSENPFGAMVTPSFRSTPKPSARTRLVVSESTTRSTAPTSPQSPAKRTKPRPPPPIEPKRNFYKSSPGSKPLSSLRKPTLTKPAPLILLPPLPQDQRNQRQQPQQETRELVIAVEIPVRLSSLPPIPRRSSFKLTRGWSRADKRAAILPKKVTIVEEDIEMDSGDSVDDHKDNVNRNDQVNDGMRDDGSNNGDGDDLMSDIESGSESPIIPTMATAMLSSLQAPVYSEWTFEYPEPASPEREYFIKTIDGMWSSPDSPPPEKPAMFFDPPIPSTPERVAQAGDTEHDVNMDPCQEISNMSVQIVDGDGDITRGRFEISRILENDNEESFLELGQRVRDEDDTNDGSSFLDGAQRFDLLEKQSWVASFVDSGAEKGPSLNLGSSSTNSQQKSVDGSSFDSSLSNVKQQPVKRLPTRYWQIGELPPSAKDCMESFEQFNLPTQVHQKPYFSKELDIPRKPKVFGGKEFKLHSYSLKYRPEFRGVHHSGADFATTGPPSIFLSKSKNEVPSVAVGDGFKAWEPTILPPMMNDVQTWIKADAEYRKQKQYLARGLLPDGSSTQLQREKISQIEGPTQANPFGCKTAPIKIAGSIAMESDFLDCLSLEVLSNNRLGLLPDPKIDPIQMLVYCWQTDRPGFVSNGWKPGYRIGIMSYADSGLLKKVGWSEKGFDIHMAKDEDEMLEKFIMMVQDLDPDILAGYEVQNASWGYLVDRYFYLKAMDMTVLLSRIKQKTAPYVSKKAVEERNSYNSTHNSGVKIPGRHLFNIWRLLRGEVNLTNYSFCNVVFHVLQQRVPNYTPDTMTAWWNSRIGVHQSRVLRYLLHKVQYDLLLIENQELASRTSEFARVFGVDFFSVISRGSQFKVESLMVRLAKPENFIMISASREQVGKQRALEHIPMIMEPESGFYQDPVVVLDFQSLYPSVMIAYNYCYSTCLGKLNGGSKFGVTSYNIQDGVLPLMQNHLEVSPNGVMYVDQKIRRSLLARMLTELLDTRVMVKKAMKENPQDKALLKLLEARQLGLKYIANVTYGYTTASFSGRMPSVDIADSIVSTGRETLERAIQFVNKNPKWKARVVYGDTDSMFVHLPGRTRQQAFEIGYDIAETITKMNPRPVKLKFEKVYHPCFLVTKKRYVGSSYETPQQQEPIFDAKGIETIRRDGVPAVQKIMEKSIKTMFRTQDLSLVKSYLVRQFAKILEERVAINDFLFGKEVRMGGYSEKGVPPPGAKVSAEKMKIDPRTEPQYGERVPYVVVYGESGARLTDQVVEPRELLRNSGLRLNGHYYITKQIIPSLERIFQLAGADVRSWFDELPRVYRATRFVKPSPQQEAVGLFAANKVRAADATERDMWNGSNRNSSNNNSKGSTSTATTTALPPVPPGASFGGFTPIPGGVHGLLDHPMARNYNNRPLSTAVPFRPRTRGTKHATNAGVGARIDRYYQVQSCVICGQSTNNSGPKPNLCEGCGTTRQDQQSSILVMQARLKQAETLFQATVQVCSSCCRASPGSAGVDLIGGGLVPFGTHASVASIPITGQELVACESIECPVFWKRRKAQGGLESMRALTEKTVADIESLCERK